jgi:hypothetical protein
MRARVGQPPRWMRGTWRCHGASWNAPSQQLVTVRGGWTCRLPSSQHELTGNDRRYGDDEIRRIFEGSGSTNRRGHVPDVSSQGLTMAGLKVIAQDVGVSPSRVSEVAASAYIGG